MPLLKLRSRPPHNDANILWHDFTLTWARMIYPNDPHAGDWEPSGDLGGWEELMGVLWAQREILEYERAQDSERVSQSGIEEPIMLDPLLLRLLLRARPWHVVIEEAQQKEYGGRVAGTILTHAHALYKVGGDASKRKAIATALKERRPLPDYIKKVFPSSEAACYQVWRDYASVAHLWAAQLVWESVDLPRGIWHFPAEGCLPGFFALAETFRGFATTYCPHPGRKPLIDPSRIWSVPDGYLDGLPDIPLEVAERSRTWLAKFRSQYRARKSFK